MIEYFCSHCDHSEILTEIIPRKICPECQMYLEANELEEMI